MQVRMTVSRGYMVRMGCRFASSVRLSMNDRSGEMPMKGNEYVHLHQGTNLWLSWEIALATFWGVKNWDA
jgi:hypothetical protein